MLNIKIGKDKISIRPINKKDVYIALQNKDLQQEILLARCINRINNIKKEKWEEEWLDIIKSLQFKDKKKYMEVLRKISYYKKDRKFPIYF